MVETGMDMRQTSSINDPDRYEYCWLPLIANLI